MDNLFKDYPALGELHERQVQLEEIDKKIESESDLTKTMHLMKVRHNLSQLQLNELFKFLMDYINKNSKIIDKFEKAHAENKEKCIKFSELLKEERANNKDLFNSIVAAMLKDPVNGFQLLLNHVDRNEKIDDSSGQSWLYNLKFTYKERLLMAWKLIKPHS